MYVYIYIYAYIYIYLYIYKFKNLLVTGPCDICERCQITKIDSCKSCLFGTNLLMNNITVLKKRYQYVHSVAHVS